jgi:hypothetical protein
MHGCHMWMRMHVPGVWIGSRFKDASCHINSVATSNWTSLVNLAEGSKLDEWRKIEGILAK